MSALDLTSTTQLNGWRARFETALSSSVRAIVDVDGRGAPARLAEAMEYALLGPGKRMRPLVLLACADACLRADRAAAIDPDDDVLFPLCMPAALALEHVHAYSLVHDDLRRGRATVHVAFDEATAILVGDALLTNAFAHAARSPRSAAFIVETLALAAGSAGMVGGQHDDTRGLAVSLEDLLAIHAKKTGCLFRAAAEMGSLAIGADAARRAIFSRYGALLGLAFQIGDDLLDISSDPVRSGKRLGRDAALAKVTFVSLLGVEEARASARRAADEAITALAGMHAPLLQALARFAAARDH